MADFEGDKACGPTHHACECFLRQLREAERLAQIHLRQAWQREDITRAELEAAIKRGVEACRWGQAGWNTARKWLVWHDDEQRLKDEAIKRAEAAEALAEARRKALVLAYANIGQKEWVKMTDRAKNIIINAQAPWPRRRLTDG